MNEVIPINRTTRVDVALDQVVSVVLDIPGHVFQKAKIEAKLAGMPTDVFMARCIVMGSLAAEMVRQEDGDDLPPCDSIVIDGEDHETF